jgi:DNA repair protein RecO (recombination protein O)
MNVDTTPAYILHRYVYRDSSLIIEAFSEQAGRVGLIARGARSARSRWRGLLQSFRPLLLSWKGRGELPTLTGAEGDGSPVAIGGSRLLSGFYLNELLIRLVARHDPHPVLFRAYDHALHELARAEYEEPVLRIFEKTLLRELGYGLLLDREAEGGEPVRPERLYEYRLESGPVQVRDGDTQALVMPGQSLLALDRDEIDGAAACRDARRLLRAALSLYLGDRPLRTREVLRRLTAMQ